MKRRLLTVSLLVVIASTASLSGAGVEKVTVRVDGLACPFCAYNIEKRVKTLPGVTRETRVVTSVEKGITRFAWNPRIHPRVHFSPSAVRKSIKEAGFTPRDVSVVARGTVRGATDKKLQKLIRLLDDDDKEPITLVQPKRADRREAWEAMKGQMSIKNIALSVRVEGKVEEVADGKWQLIVERWSPLEFGAEVVAMVDDLACEQCSTRVMRLLRKFEGVIHVTADHEADHVHVWTKGAAPDVAVIRERLESLGFKVKDIKRVPMKKQKHEQPT